MVDNITRLEKEFIEAIANDDAERLEKLIIISDLIHKGALSYEGYTDKDLASDAKYEEAKEKLKNLKQLDAAISLSKIKSQPKTISDKIKEQRKKVLTFMDGIQITKIIPELSNVILMPKFDGCSIAVEIVKNNDEFIIRKAHTRGSDDLTGNRKCQDKTDYINEIFSNKLKYLNEKIKESKFYNLRYKDKTKTGNNNEELIEKIDVATIDYILIRGEFVSNDKSNISLFDSDREKFKDFPNTNIGLASGAINSDREKFDMYKDYITFKPFEIPLIKTSVEKKTSEIVINEYIPTQESALKILKYFNLIDYKYYTVDSIDAAYNMEKVLEVFEKQCKEPLDGVVYCCKNWTYPSCEEETSKRVNYGKYKFKRENKRQTKLIDISYTIGKTGKLTPSFIVNKVNINGKNYSRAKTTFNVIQKYIDECKEKNKEFGKGLVCELELRSDIAPYICNVYPEASKNIEEISIIDKCPYCGKELSVEEKKSKGERIINITCVNDKCKGINIQRCAEFLKSIGYKGISEKTLKNIEFKHFKNLYDSLLATKEDYHQVGKKDKIIFSENTMKTRIANEKKKSFSELITNRNTKDFLIDTSVCTKTHTDKFIEDYEIKPGETILTTLKKNENFVNRLREENYFVRDLVNFLIEEFV